jgi:hypothetical protein
VTYSEANEAAKRTPYSGEEVVLPTEQGGEEINQRPAAVLPAELAEERGDRNDKPKISTGEVVIALGRLAAIGETQGNRVTSAYLLAEIAEPIHEASGLDSMHLRELYMLAKSGTAKKPEGGSVPFIP